LLEFLLNSGISVGGAIAGFPSGFIDCCTRMVRSRLKMLNIYLFLSGFLLVMLFCYAFGSGIRDLWVEQNSDWSPPSHSNRHLVKLAAVIVSGFAAVFMNAYLGDSMSLNREQRALYFILNVFCFIAGFFIKFRNFSWWRNCRIAKWFY
jgi:hypothetical protein